MAAVLRPQLADAEPDFAVLLVRRSQRASFMANAYVFPGGRVDSADGQADPDWPTRHAAARELAEEAGLLVADPTSLVRFAHWITPSAEPKRFDADCYLVSSEWTRASHGEDVKVDGEEVFDPLWINVPSRRSRPFFPAVGVGGKGGETERQELRERSSDGICKQAAEETYRRHRKRMRT